VIPYFSVRSVKRKSAKRGSGERKRRMRSENKRDSAESLTSGHPPLLRQLDLLGRSLRQHPRLVRGRPIVQDRSMRQKKRNMQSKSVPSKMSKRRKKLPRSV
jgi:hypothetical protein